MSAVCCFPVFSNFFFKKKSGRKKLMQKMSIAEMMKTKSMIEKNDVGGEHEDNYDNEDGVVMIKQV
jgi:hypothetical protein